MSFDDDLKDVISIRRKVFVEELSIPEEIEFDEYDKNAMHVLVYDESTINTDNCDGTRMHKVAVATGRIVYDGDVCQMGRIAVLKDFRNKKLGDFTVRMLMNKAFTAGIDNIILNARPEAIDFYKKIGFHLVEENKRDDNKCFNMTINSKDVTIMCKK